DSGYVGECDYRALCHVAEVLGASAGRVDGLPFVSVGEELIELSGGGHLVDPLLGDVGVPGVRGIAVASRREVVPRVDVVPAGNHRENVHREAVLLIELSELPAHLEHGEPGLV